MAQVIKDTELVNASYDVNDIISKAEEVVKIRKNNADKVSLYHQEIEKWKDPVLDALVSIKDKMELHHKDDPETSDIMEECTDLHSMILDFSRQVYNLDQRFKNQKIRITSIGASRMGKSTFTQLYTSLPEDLIKTQAGSKDCTGAICNINNDDALSIGDFYADVEFLKENEVLGSVNSLISQVRKEKGDASWDCSGDMPSQFSSLAQIRECINKGIFNQLEKEVAGLDISLQTSITGYFKSSYYLDCVGKPVKRISKANGDQLEEYNYMDHSTPKYLSVKKIELYANLQNNGLFKYFVVGDTMGLSEQASPSAKEEVKKAIFESDAVFSVHLANQTAKLGFYNFMSGIVNGYRQQNGTETLAKKHFIIVNRHPDLDDASMDQTVHLLEQTRTSDVIYTGYLKAKDSDDHIPEKFAKGTVTDMLGKIANYVLEFDKERIKVCNNSISDIKSKLGSLINKLGNVALDIDFSEKDYARDFYEKVCTELADKIKTQMDALDIKDVDYEEAKKDPNNKLRSPYEIICGEKPAPSDFDNTDLATEKLLKKHLDKYRNGLSLVDVHFAETLDKITADVIRDIDRNLPSGKGQIDKLYIDQERNDLFKGVWEKFRISENIWKQREDCENEFIKKLIELYEQPFYENAPKTPDFFMHYHVFRSLYKNGDLEEDDLKSSKQLFEDNAIIDTFKDLIEKMKLPEYLEDTYTGKSEAIKELYKSVYTRFKNLSDIDSATDYYSQRLALIMDDEFSKKKDLCDANKQILECINVITKKKDEFASIESFSL